MIDALIAGRVFGTPTERTSKNGSRFASAKVRTPTASGEAIFVSVIAFSHTAIDALLALADGDSVALSGELKVTAYSAKDGTAKPSLDLTAFVVLTEYHVQRKRKAVSEQAEHPTHPEPFSPGDH